MEGGSWIETRLDILNFLEKLIKAAVTLKEISICRLKILTFVMD